VLQDRFENIEIPFKLSVYFSQFYDTATNVPNANSPNLLVTFPVTILPCSTLTAVLTPDAPTSYTYIVTKTMEPLEF
jgi:hypothetical protein